MKSVRLSLLALLFATIVSSVSLFAQSDMKVVQLGDGVWRVRLGEPEKITPVQLQIEKEKLQAASEEKTGIDIPIDFKDITFHVRDRGLTLELPLEEQEQVFGLGLQVMSFNHRGFRKWTVVNSNRLGNVGLTHAPAPYYVSSKGYAVLVDTARYAFFYCGSHPKLDAKVAAAEDDKRKAESTEELYGKKQQATAPMVVDIPAAKGVDVYLFAGPDMRNAIARYNMFSGGGSLPPMWGLGVKYRGKGSFNEEQLLHLANYFREADMPCDMFGFEPGWHTHAYSCTYVWEPKRFPDPNKTIETFNGMNYKLNLWEHAYVHPNSPIYELLKPYAGDFPVWEGLVPDFTDKKARDIFADYHEEYLVKRGIMGFKLDECDNANFLEADRQWGFPEASKFPSGADGEQMHSLLGLLYQKTMMDVFKRNNVRTWGDVRASGACASKYPFTLYSDMYDYEQYTRMLLNGGFSGMLWSPEVRNADSEEELIRRIQLAMFAPQMCFNCWFIKNPPWLQYDVDKNNADAILADHKILEAKCRTLLEMRMSLIPYLYSSFWTYHKKGIPPFRALVVDYHKDANTYKIDDELLIGESLLFAPLPIDSKERNVYLPEGNWYCFWTRKEFKGGKWYRVRYEDLIQMPLFVKSGTILPLAKPHESVQKDTHFEITALCFGEKCRPAVLVEDDGESFAFEKGEYNLVELRFTPDAGGTVSRNGKFEGKRYKVVGWETIE